MLGTLLFQWAVCSSRIGDTVGISFVIGSSTVVGMAPKVRRYLIVQREVHASVVTCLASVTFHATAVRPPGVS